MRLPTITENRRGRDIAYVVALGILQAALLMLSAFATRVVFGALADGGVFPKLAIAALIAVPLCLALVQAMARVSAEKIGQSFAIDLRETVFRAIAALPEKERTRRSLGGLSLRFVGDMTAARGWAGLGVTRLISGAIVLPAAALALWLLNPTLALAGMAPIVLAMVFFVLIGLRLHRVHKGLRKRRAGAAIWAMERIARASDLARLGRLDRECKQLNKRATRVAEDSVRRIRTTSTLRMVPNASLGLGSAAVLVAALSLRLPTGETAAALAVLAILTIPSRQLVGVWDKHAAWTIARAKCQLLLDRAGELPEKTKVFQVTAEPVVLKGSLRRALTMGCNKRPEDSELEALATSLGIKQPLDFKVGEGGQNLSRAARLRVALAQAITSGVKDVVLGDAFWADPEADRLSAVFTAHRPDCAAPFNSEIAA